MLTVKKLSDEEFEKIAAEHPDLYIPLEQSSVWGGYDELMGGRKILGIYGYYKNSQLIATTRLNYYSLPMRNILFSTKGPVWYVDATPELEAELIDTMKTHFAGTEKLAITFIRMWVKYPQDGVTVKPFEDVLADREIWIDIDKSPEDLLQSFSSTTRRYIRKADREGTVDFRIIEDQEKAAAMFSDGLMDIMDETSTRNGFDAHPQEIYQATLKGMPDNSQLVICYVDNEPEAWAINTYYHGFSTYLFGASTAKARKAHASSVMMYKSMLDMAEKGNKLYNLTGVESPDYPSLKDVTQFKLRFSKDVTQLPIVYDIPLNTMKYKLAVKTLTGTRKAKSLTSNLRTR
ncbi:MAG: peptidoglycan bridge formation glycyltransferase FemA/FemB family protein [Micrococcaceae bacterium]